MATRKSTPKKSSPRKSSSNIKVEVDKDSSVSVRQIENGFLVSESGQTGKGRNQKWYNKEFYSKTNPLKNVLSGGGGSTSGGNMKFGGRK